MEASAEVPNATKHQRILRKRNVELPKWDARTPELKGFDAVMLPNAFRNLTVSLPDANTTPLGQFLCEQMKSKGIE